MTLLEQARIALQQDDRLTARNLLAALVQQEPQNHDAWKLLAETLDDPQQVAFCRQRAQSVEPQVQAFPNEAPRFTQSQPQAEERTQTVNQSSTPARPKPTQQGNPLQKFLNEEQDPAVVQQVFAKVRQILTSGEEALYIAVQKSLINLSPDCAVLTNKRFIIYRPTLLGGASFDDYIWRDLHDARLNEGMMRATVSMTTLQGRVLTLGDLPKAQARKLYSFAQEMEEKVREERRARDMEEKRAAAGGIVLQGGLPTAPAPALVPQEDPMEKLKKLKGMMDAGLITPQEYEAKKADILSRF